MKQFSGNTLYELLNLMSRIDGLIKQDYCHVSDHLPKALKTQVKNFIQVLDKEIERREEEF